MFIKRRNAVIATAVLSCLISVGFGTQAFASKGEPKVEAKQDDNCADPGMVVSTNAQTASFANISLNNKQIILLVEGAKVLIKHVPDSTEIILKSNCPRNWWVHGSQIRQAGFCGDIRKGSSLLADEMGSRAIVDGRIFLFPPGPLKGLKLGGGKVTANGEDVEPIKGSDIPCNCSGEDYLEVLVPQSFSGDLKIGSTGHSAIKVDHWKDGALECVMLGNSSFSSGKLESLPKAAFDNKGSGSADISEVDAKIFVASIKGNGNASIRVLKGKADMSNATVEGNGTIELHGSFKKLQQLVDGPGKIEVKP